MELEIRDYVELVGTRSAPGSLSVSWRWIAPRTIPSALRVLRRNGESESRELIPTVRGDTISVRDESVAEDTSYLYCIGIPREGRPLLLRGAVVGVWRDEAGGKPRILAARRVGRGDVELSVLLPQQGEVTCAAFDVIGRKTGSQVVSGVGLLKIVIPRSVVQSNVYFLRAESRLGVASKKLVVVW